MSSHARGRVIVVSGPSASGKTTLVQRLFERGCGPLLHSVSATTRAPRPGETDGVNYHFLTPDEFARRRERGDFLECHEVYGPWYGTLRSEVTSGLEAGKWVVLEIDVQGMLSVTQEYPEAVTVFVRPGDPSELERRLRGRGTETESAIRRRLDEAARELSFAGRYRHQVINDDLERAVQEVCDLLTRTEE